jgi:uncharacterized secreted protein with C-terminal beta-propeller domain
MFIARIEKLESRRLLSAAVAAWSVRGDADPNDPDDVIDVSVSDTDPTKLVATVNGEVVDTRDASKVQAISISGGNGDDDISVDLGDYSKNIKVTIDGGAGNDSITAGDEADVIYGGAGSDTIDGGAGNDSIYGGAGSDDLSGGDGNDVINGGGNNDTIAGGWGNDSIDGGNGSDDLQGGAGKDTETGEAGNDTLHGGDGSDKIDGGNGSNMDYIDTTDRVIRHRHDHFNPDDLPTYGRLQTQADLTQWWIDRAVAEYQYLFGTRGFIFRGGVDGGIYAVNTTDSGAAGNSPGATTVMPIHSTTNNQEAGVNEADLVQTDGRYIYTLTGNDLVIVDTTTAGGPSVVSTTALSGDVSGMYLDGSRITLVGQNYDESVIPFDGIAVRPGLLWRAFGSTQVTTLDVTDPAAPAVVSVTKLDGTLTDSRMIDGRLYVVVGDSMVHGPLPLMTGTGSDGNPIYETESQYRARIEADPSLLSIPRSSTTVNGQTTSADLINAPDIYIPQNASDSWIDQGNITSVVLIDTHDAAPAPKSTTSIVGYGDTVYASRSAMYLATYDWTNQGTRILKFGLGTEHVTFEASGGVEGSVQDRFSMGELPSTDAGQGNVFAIATTTQPWFEDFVSADGGTSSTDSADVQTNSVFTLTQDGARLNLLGSLTGLAPDESIQSVRFVGDRAFISTFHQTDPLLSIDLSDPAHPGVVGQLVVPGFLSYLQPLSDTLLMGLGQNADPATGATDWSGVELSLFNVSDPAHPVEIDTIQLNPSTDQSFADSEAEWDPHAITYIPDQHILALPVNGDLELIGVDAMTGLHEAAVIPADTNDTIHRTVRIDGDVFAVGDTHITERAFTDLHNTVASLRIAPDPQIIVDPLPILEG